MACAGTRWSEPGLIAHRLVDRLGRLPPALEIRFAELSLSASDAGIDNDLFYRDNTMMLFADAKKNAMMLFADAKKMVDNIVKSL